MDARLRTPTHIAARPRLAIGAALAAAAILVAGCGGSSSTTQAKPAFCANIDTLKSSIKALPSTITGGTSAIETQVLKIQSEAQSILPSAKSDFPSQSEALSTSLNTLVSEAKKLGSSPSVTQIAGLGIQATTTVKDADAFFTAVKTKCG